MATPMPQPSYTRHRDYPSWMRAIRAHPADDNVRLQYADWLDEQVGSCEACGGKGYIVVSAYPKCPTCHGTGTNGAAERAEFIRLGIELESLIASMPEPPCPENARAYEINKRLRVLEKYFGFGLGNLRQSCITERGFIFHVRCTLAQFNTHADEICRHHPVTTWEITDRDPHNIHDRYAWWHNYPLESAVGDLIDSMVSGMNLQDIFSFGRFFPTREAAIAALNAACISISNQRAESNNG